MTNHFENQSTTDTALPANEPNTLQGADWVHQTIDRTAQGALSIVDRLSEKAAPTAEHLRASVNNAATALHSGIEGFDETQERWLGHSRGQVRDYPLVSLGIALAAGVLVGRLLPR